MNAKDKEYVDRQHNMLRTELTSLRDRLIVLEGKHPVISSTGNNTIADIPTTVKFEIDRAEVYDILLRACHDCLEQRHQRFREEDRIAAEALRAKCEAEGKPYFENEYEWRQAIYASYSSFFDKMLGIVTCLDHRYSTITNTLKNLTALVSPLPTSKNPTPNRPSGKPSSSPSASKSEALKAKHPDKPSLRHHLHNFLTGNFTLPRHYTLLAVILYLSLLFLTMFYNH